MNCKFVSIFIFVYTSTEPSKKALSLTCYSVFPDRQLHTIKMFVPHDADNFKSELSLND